MTYGKNFYTLVGQEIKTAPNQIHNRILFRNGSETLVTKTNHSYTDKV